MVEMRDQGEKAPSWSGTASVGTPSSKESENTKYTKYDEKVLGTLIRHKKILRKIRLRDTEKV